MDIGFFTGAGGPASPRLALVTFWKHEKVLYRGYILGPTRALISDPCPVG